MAGNITSIGMVLIIMTSPKLAKKYYYYMFIVVLVSIAFKLMFIAHPFHGLEYEDAFVFSDVARYLQYSYNWNIDPFQTKSCMDGSLTDCNQFGTFGGHYMILPVVVFMANEICGYSINNIFVVNFIASILVLYVYVKILKLLDVCRNGIIFSSTLLVATPFLNVFNTSGLSETFSSLWVIGTIYFYLKSSQEDFEYNKTSFWFAILLIVISFATKRENLVLLSLPVITILLLAKNRILKLDKLLRLLLFFAIPFGLALVYNLMARVNEMEAAEGIELGVATFSLVNFAQLFPHYLSSFFHINYFGITGVLFLITGIYAILVHKKIEYKLVAMLAFLYLVMYSSHYRSYYQVHFGKVSIFETLRYTTNYFPIACICFGSLNVIYDKIIDKSLILKARYVGFFLIFIVASIYLNVTTRLELNRIEYEERIRPVVDTLNFTNQEDWIMSDISSIYHIYANNKRKFIDCYATNERRIFDLIKYDAGQIYLLKRKSNIYNRKRYPEYFEIISNLDYKVVKNISPDYELIKFVK